MKKKKASGLGEEPIPSSILSSLTARSALDDKESLVVFFADASDEGDTVSFVFLKFFEKYSRVKFLCLVVLFHSSSLISVCLSILLLRSRLDQISSAL